MAVFTFFVGLTVAAILGAWESTVTLKGWISDKGCAQAKVNAEAVTPNGTTCVKKCLDDGAEAVFVHPDSRTLYAVRNYTTLREDVGYHLELTGEIDEKTKTITVQSARRLEEIVNVCAIPKKKP